MHVIRESAALPERRSTIYPPELSIGFEGRIKRALTEALGLEQFGVNLTTLEPGAKSSHRHWHKVEDECVYILSGTATLVTDEGDTVLTAGMAAGFPAGEANAHHLINRGAEPVTFLEIGTRSADEVATYADVDLHGIKTGGLFRFFRKSGEPFK